MISGTIMCDDREWMSSELGFDVREEADARRLDDVDAYRHSMIIAPSDDGREREALIRPAMLRRFRPS